jgi:metal-dependent hydrolase (beta-lactamase superfamily II)
MQQNDPCHEFDWSAVGNAALLGAATGGIGEIANALKAYKAANKVKKVIDGVFLLQVHKLRQVLD